MEAGVVDEDFERFADEKMMKGTQAPYHRQTIILDGATFVFSLVQWVTGTEDSSFLYISFLDRASVKTYIRSISIHVEFCEVGKTAVSGVRSGFWMFRGCVGVLVLSYITYSLLMIEKELQMWKKPLMKWPWYLTDLRKLRNPWVQWTKVSDGYYEPGKGLSVIFWRTHGATEM